MSKPLPRQRHRLRRAPEPHWKLLPLAGACMLLFGAGYASAQLAPVNALPTAPLVRAGTVSVGPGANGNIQQITQSSPRAAIDWNTFTIGRDAQVRISQPNAQSVLLNRVVGPGDGVAPERSLIEGTLSANGRVFLINTSGILFGANARVNVGGLLASTLDVANPDQDATFTNFLNGQTLNLATSGNRTALIFVDAAASGTPQIQAGPGGEVLLIGNGALAPTDANTGPLFPSLPYVGSVTLLGRIAAQGGRVHLAAGDTATVSLPVGESGFVTLSNIGAAARAVGVTTDSGSAIDNPGGSVVLESVSQNTLGPSPTVSVTGSFAVGGLRPGISAIFAAGSLSAKNDSAEPQSQVQFLPRGAATYAAIGGDVDVSGSSNAASGGLINVSAQNILLQGIGASGPPASFNASGPAGGGRITLGGSDTLLLQVADTSALRANATNAGDGGRITLQGSFFNPTPPATPVAQVDFGVASIGGTIEAQGRGAGHSGGVIETSAAALNVAAKIDASGQAGATAGTWVIDPFDVRITNDPTTAVVDFAPTAVGANIRAADISQALDTGTSVTVSTGTGGPAFAGQITLESDVAISRKLGNAPVTLTMAAADGVTLRTGSLITSGAGPLNVNLTADSDGNGVGGILMKEGPASILTAGGNVVFSGGTDPSTGFAQGRAALTAGIDMASATIDTRGAGGAGDVTLRGSGYSGAGYDTAGVQLLTTHIDANNVSITGRSSAAPAISLLTSTVATTSGTIDLRGVSDPSVSFTTANSNGVELTGSDLLIGTGSAVIAGRGGARGVLLDGVRILSDDNAGSSVAIVGESTAGALPGVAVGTNGLEIRGSSAGSAFTGAEVQFGARTAAAPHALDLDAAFVRTRGHVGLRPAGVDAEGAITEDTARAIYIGSAPDFSATPRTDFLVSGAWLVPPTSTPAGATGRVGALASPQPPAGITAQGGIVIGSGQHTGAITVGGGETIASPNAKITLQNEGAGSSGITLNGAVNVDTLGVFTTGNVSEGGSLSTNTVLIRAGATSDVDLASATNRIGSVAFSSPRSLRLRSLGDLTVGSGTASGFDPLGSGFVDATLSGGNATQSVLLQSLDANLALAQPIAMQGTGSQLDLVASGVFLNPASATLTNGAEGAWRIWSQTSTGSSRGGLAGTAPGANLYGCTFGDATSCGLSGVAIPTGGDHFFYVERPTLNVTSPSLTFQQGQPIPPITLSQSGLINGDSLAEVLSGQPSTAATSTSAAGRYTIDAGTLAAGNGYRLNYEGGVVDVTAARRETPQGVAGNVDLAGVTTEEHSEVYGRNRSLPAICTAASLARLDVELDNDNASPLAIEWARVRTQPQLTSCTNVRDAADCAAF